ncbi:redoxin domain-containing protein [Flammeovirgaceae bacterium SG7u.111]|nr:redoxin domain-containing protein [Flammeovirgaceae bacterium SG7u.132]WPO35923.1 redoxin domain-containing protein [Flammeovirgaceae bacterium SG7u.111]
MGKALRRNSFLWIVFVFSAMFFSCGGPKTPKAGEFAPDFKLKGINGNDYTLSDYKGKLVLLYFWVDNCDICKKEFPVVQENYEELKGEGFEILGIYIGDKTEPSKEFKEAYGVTFPMLVDETYKVIDEYNITASPTNYLVNPDGKIVRRIVGYLDKQQISSLLYNIKMNK